MIFGLAGQAGATSYSSSLLLVEEATFGGPGFTGFSTFFFRLNGVSATVNATTKSSGAPVVAVTPIALDQPIQCVGPAGTCDDFANNVYFPSIGPSIPLGSYAVADSHELDTSIAGGSTGTWGSETQAQLTGPVFGVAETGTDNTLQWNFFVPTGATVTFDALLTQNFEVFLDAAAAAGSLAHATASMNVQVQQGGATVPGGLLFSLAAHRPLCSDSTVIGPGPGGSHPCADEESDIGGTVVLAPSALAYSLLITFDTSADVLQFNAVPEPASLLLLGGGLLAVGMVTRRRLQK